MSTDIYGVRVLDLDPGRRRVRFRVFVVYYDEAWGSDLLPANDPTFFFHALCEGAERSRYSLLEDLVGHHMRDSAWADRHTHRFVERVERVATRNHPVNKEQFERLSTFYYERDGCWEDEDQLAQGDYEVQVTDSRWLAPLYRGQSWSTPELAEEADLPPEDAGAPIPDVRRAAADEVLIFPVDHVVDDTESEYEWRAADGDADAAFVLGWLRQERGDTPGAAEAYRQAADGSAPASRAKALLYLGDLHAEQRNTEEARAAYEQALACKSGGRRGDLYRSRAAMGLGTLLRSLDREEEAQAAYALAQKIGDPDVVREACRLAGTETLAQQCYRLVQEADRTSAQKALTEVYDSASVAEFGTALCEKNFALARTQLEKLTATNDLESAAEFGIDLAVAWSGEYDDNHADKALKLVIATGTAVGVFRRALDRVPTSGMSTSKRAYDSSPSENAFLQLIQLIAESGDLDGVAQIAGVAGQAYPAVTSRGCQLLGIAAFDRDDLPAAAEWFQRGAEFSVSKNSAAQAAYNLGLTRMRQGEVDLARKAFAQAEKDYVYYADTLQATRKLAELANNQGDWAGASAVWARVAFRESVYEAAERGRGALGEKNELSAAWSVLRLGELLAELGERVAALEAYQVVRQTQKRPPSAIADVHRYRLLASEDEPRAQKLLRSMAKDAKHPFSDRAKTLLEVGHDDGSVDFEVRVVEARSARAIAYDACATYHYAHSLLSAGHQELARTLLLKVAEGTGKFAAGAAVTLGEDAHEADDNDTARGWWLRAIEFGDAKMTHSANMNLGMLAKESGDVPEFLRRYVPIAESSSEDAPFAAAHLGDLYYLLKDAEEAVRWYRLTLDHTDDPELVGEAAYRVAEILHGRGETEAARPLLQRAVDSGDAKVVPQAAALLANTDGSAMSYARPLDSQAPLIE